MTAWQCHSATIIRPGALASLSGGADHGRRAYPQPALLPGMPAARPPGIDRIPAQAWAEIIADPSTAARYYGRIWRGAGHWWWTGAIDGSGHGSIWSHGRQLSAHALGWQLVHGPAGTVAGQLPIIRHACDNASCQRPACLAAGTPADNAADYQVRRWRPESPLADARGPRGRAVAVRKAIRAALRGGTDPEDAIRQALAAGVPAGQQALPLVVLSSADAYGLSDLSRALA